MLSDSVENGIKVHVLIQPFSEGIYRVAPVCENLQKKFCEIETYALMPLFSDRSYTPFIAKSWMEEFVLSASHVKMFPTDTIKGELWNSVTVTLLLIS